VIVEILSPQISLLIVIVENLDSRCFEMLRDRLSFFSLVSREGDGHVVLEHSD